MASFTIGAGNGHEIAEEANEEDGFGEHDNNVGFLADDSVLVGLDITLSLIEVTLLVDSDEVGQLPDAEEDNGNQGEQLRGPKKSSGSSSVLNQPRDNKIGTNKKWAKDEQADHGIPPMDVLVQKEPVIPKEKDDRDDKSEDCDNHNSAFDWHTSAAGSVLSVFCGADTHAAAAFFLDWWGVWIIIVLYFLWFLWFFGGFFL